MIHQHQSRDEGQAALLNRISFRERKKNLNKENAGELISVWKIVLLYIGVLSPSWPSTLTLIQLLSHIKLLSLLQTLVAQMTFIFSTLLL